MAETTACHLEQMAVMYRTLAEGKRSPHIATSMLSRAARLEARAERERAEAARLREIVSRAAADTRTARG
jgi:hypothetical protein